MKSIIGVILAGVIFFGIMFGLSARFMPNSPFYNFKRISEKGVMATKRNPESKAEHYLTLLDTRYQELTYVTKTKNYDYVLSSSLRYSTTAGEATNFIQANHLTSFVPQMKQRFKKHKSTFLYYSPRVGIVGNQSKYLQDAANYIDLYTGQLDKVK